MENLIPDMFGLILKLLPFYDLVRLMWSSKKLYIRISNHPIWIRWIMYNITIVKEYLKIYGIEKYAGLIKDGLNKNFKFPEFVGNYYIIYINAIHSRYASLKLFIRYGENFHKLYSLNYCPEFVGFLHYPRFEIFYPENFLGLNLITLYNQKNEFIFDFWKKNISMRFRNLFNPSYEKLVKYQNSVVLMIRHFTEHNYNLIYFTPELFVDQKYLRISGKIKIP